MDEGYKDRDGKPVSLDRLVCAEPEWAANRIRAEVAKREADHTHIVPLLQ